MAGNLKIIDSSGEVLTPPSEKLLKRFGEKDSRKLLAIFNAELNDIEKLWTVKRRTEGPIVDICCDPARETKCQGDVENLEDLLKSLKTDVIHCQDQAKSKEEIIKILNKEVGVVCIPSESHQNMLRVHARDEGDLKRAIARLNGSSGRADPKPSSRQNRSFSNHVYDNPDTDMASGGSVASPADVKMTFKTSNGLTVKIYKGAITKLDVDLVVNAANDQLMNGAGVAGALSKAGGYDFDQECRSSIRSNGRIPVTENVLTGAGNMHYKGVVHAVGPQWYNINDKVECVKKVRDTVVEILKTAAKSGHRSIAMPPISSGLFGVPTDLCAAMYVLGIIDFSENAGNLSKLREFHIIDIKDEVLDMVIDYYTKWSKDPSALAPGRLVSQHPKVNKGDNFNQNWQDKRDGNNRQDHRHGQGHGGSQGHGYHGWQDNKGDKYKHDWQDKQDGQGYGYDQDRLNQDSNNRKGYQHNQGHRGGQSRGRPQRKTICTFENDTFIFRGKLRVFISHGDILKCAVDAIVATEGRDHKGAISQALERANGSSYKKAITDAVFGKYPGQVIMVESSKKMKHLRCIYYIIMERFLPSVPPTSRQLKILKSNVLKVLDQANILPPMVKNLLKKDKYQPLEKIAMSIPGAGALDTPLYVERCSEAMFEAFDEFARRNKRMQLLEVHVVDMREKDIVKVMRDTFHNKLRSFEQRPLPPTPRPPTNIPQASGRYDEIRESMVPGRGSQNKFCTEQYQKVEEWGISKHSSSRMLDMDQFTNRVSKAKGNMMILSGDSSKLGSGSVGRGATGGGEVEDNCVICMDTFDDPVKLKRCGHMFCKDCISESFKQKPMCPVCTTVYSVIQGDQPFDGKATVYRDYASLPGYSGSKTFIINYFFSDGIQDEDHPEPGERYKGLNRQAYLPDNPQGHLVKDMLREAFQQRLTFTIGQSRTSGENNVVTWNDIHHKTRRDGGPEKYGYPDNGYLDRVTDELNAKGIGL